MTTAIVLFVVIVVHYYFPKISLLRDYLQANGSLWVKPYIESSSNAIGKINFLPTDVVAALIILPIVIATFLLNGAILLLLKQFGSAIFMAATLLYCLNSVVEDEYQSILVSTHEQIFGIVFWFVTLGAPGAVMYWLLTTSKNMQATIASNNAHLDRGLIRLHGLAAWLPSRLTGLIYALVGDFVKAFSCWYTCMKTATIPSSTVLLDCGQAAVHVVSKQDEEELVARAIVAWIILAMLIALII